MFARHQRADGLLPYKVTEAGPAYNQIQMVTLDAEGREVSRTAPGVVPPTA